MKEKAYLGFELLMVVAVVGLNFAFLNDYMVETILFKSMASLFFVLGGFCGYVRWKEHRNFSRLLLIAVICCMAGDVFLAFDSSGILFVLGVVSFATAHVLFSIAFCHVAPLKKTDIAAMIVPLMVFFLLIRFCAFDFKGLLPVLVFYVAIISFMAVKAVTLWSFCEPNPACMKLLALGGVLFLLSDLVLLFWLFGVDSAKEIQSLNWVLYYASQLCTTVALNHGIKQKAR